MEVYHRKLRRYDNGSVDTIVGFSNICRKLFAGDSLIDCSSMMRSCTLPTTSHVKNLGFIPSVLTDYFRCIHAKNTPTEMEFKYIRLVSSHDV